MTREQRGFSAFSIAYVLFVVGYVLFFDGSSVLLLSALAVGVFPVQHWLFRRGLDEPARRNDETRDE